MKGLRSNEIKIKVNFEHTHTNKIEIRVSILFSAHVKGNRLFMTKIATMIRIFKKVLISVSELLSNDHYP